MNFQITERKRRRFGQRVPRRPRRKCLRLRPMRPVFVVCVRDVRFVKQPRQRQRAGFAGKIRFGQRRNLIRHRPVMQRFGQNGALICRKCQNLLPQFHCYPMCAQHIRQKHPIHRVQRQRRTAVPARAVGVRVARPKRLQLSDPVCPVNFHQRLRRMQQQLRTADVIRQFLLRLGQGVPAVGVMSGNRLAGQRRRARHFQQVQKCPRLRVFQVIRRNLPRHIHRDPAFQPQHHVRKRAVQIVNLMQKQPLFQHHRHPKHPLFCKFRVLRHFVHRHIAVHHHRHLRFAEHRRFQKIQLRVLHLAQPHVRPRRWQLEHRARHFERIKMNRANVFVQVKRIQLRQKRRHAAVSAARFVQQPCAQLRAALRRLFQRFRRARQQSCQYLAVGRAAALCRHIGRDTGREPLRVRRLAGAAAEPGDGGRIVIGIRTHPRDVPVHHLQQRIEFFLKPRPVRRVHVVAAQKRRRNRVRVELYSAARCGRRDGHAQPVEHLRVRLRHAVAGAVPAQAGRRQARRIAQFSGGASQCFHIFI